MLKRLCWARVQCWVLTEASSAAEALRREQQVSALGLPADVKSLPALPATLGLTLRQGEIGQQGLPQRRDIHEVLRVQAILTAHPIINLGRRLVHQQSGKPAEDCALVVGAAADSSVADAAPAGWQVLAISALPTTAEQAAPPQQAAAPHAQRNRQTIASLHDVLWATVSSHFLGGVIPARVSSPPDAKAGTAQLVVAHVMKLSREAALAQRGMLPLLPADGVCFVPLCLDRPLDSQGPFHVVLHKVWTR